MNKHQKGISKVGTEVKPGYNILLAGLLAFTVLLIVFVRIRLLNIPLERDEGEYAYAGQLMMKGIPPYEGVYNMKFPGVYFMYFLIETLFGQTIRAIHFGALLVNLLCAFFIYRLSKKLFDAPAALISAISFLLLSLTDTLQGIYANAEHFVLLFMLPGILFILKAIEKKSILKLFLAGIFLGLAVIMKQFAAVFVVFGSIWIIRNYLFNEKIERKIRFRFIAKHLFVFSAGVIIPFLLTIGILSIAGVFKNFWWLTFEYAREYVSQNTWKDIWDNFIFRMIFKANPLLWIFCLSGIISVIFRRNKTNVFFLLSFALFSFLAVCPGFYFRPHYFILILPAASLLIGAAFHSLTISKRLKPELIRVIAPALLLVSVFSYIILNSSYLFSETPEEVSNRLFPREHFNEMVEVSKHIKENTFPTDLISVIGSEPEIYFYSQRRSASGYIYCYPLLEDQKYRRQMQAQFFSEIENARPKYVVLINTIQAWAINLSERDKIFEWCHKFLDLNYRVEGVGDVYSQSPDSSWENTKETIEIYRRKE